MKKLFACLMAAFVCLASCAFAFVTPASAAESDNSVNGWYRYIGNNSTTDENEIFVGRVVAFDSWYDTSLPSDITECLTSYVVSSILVSDRTITNTLFLAGDLGCVPSTLVTDSNYYYLSLGQLVYVDGVIPDYASAVDFYNSFVPHNPFEGLADYLPTPSVPTPSPTPTNGGIYGSIYELITDSFYGENASLSGDQQLVATVLATAAIVFMFALPFLIVWLLIRSIGSWR